MMGFWRGDVPWAFIFLDVCTVGLRRSKLKVREPLMYLKPRMELGSELIGH